MAEILGGRTILAGALPTGVDATRLAQWQLKSGTTWAEFLARTANALGAFNAELVQRWGDLIFITEEIMMEYPNGGAITESKVITDVDVVDPRHETTIGHMIDLLVYGDALGGTRRSFRDAREAQLRADIRGVVNRLRESFEKAVLTRLFSNSETAVGSSGYNVPFVRGTGGNVDFAPPAFGGETFTTSHDHYLGVDDDTYDYDDMLNQLAETLQEHGHEPPYIAICSRADVSTVVALTAYTQILSQNVIVVDRGGATSGNQFFTRENREFGRFGYFQSEYGEIELRATNRVPTKYVGLYKSYGVNNEQNPIAIRVHPDEGFGARIVSQSSNDPRFPIEQMRVEMEHGIGVGSDRTSAAAAYLHSSGTFTAPTIS